jgi:hypothetical protein
MNKQDLTAEAGYLQNVVHGAMHEDPASLRNLTDPSTLYRLYTFLKEAAEAIRGGSSKRTAGGRPSQARGISKKPKRRR